MRRIVVRRLNGVVISFEGDSVLTLIADGQREFHYQFPTKLFFEANITAPHQPFQLDELDFVIGRKKFRTYEIRPAASLADEFIDSIDTDPEIEAAQALIDRAFA